MERSVERIAVNERDDAPPQHLVQALHALLRSSGSQIERQAARAEARSAVTSFVQRRRAQGERADRVLAIVRAACRHAHTLHGGTIDRLAEPWRALRDEVVRWAMRADVPDLRPRPEFATPPEISPGL